MAAEARSPAPPGAPAPLEEFALAFEDFARDDSIAVVVLTGAGTRAFSTGADLREYRDVYLPRPRDYTGGGVA